MSNSKTRSAKIREAIVAEREFTARAVAVPRPTVPLVVRAIGGAGGFKLTEAGARYYLDLVNEFYDEVAGDNWEATFPVILKIQADLFGVSPGRFCGLGLVWDRDHPATNNPVTANTAETPKSAGQSRQRWENFYHGATD